MAKILLNDKSLRVQLSDIHPNKFNETSYFNTTVSDDGVNIIITNDHDPNFVDVTIAYADISFPITGSITELVDLIRTVILSKNGLLTVYNESTDVVTGTLGLQNVHWYLYWNGVLLSGGGGGGLTTANQGLTVNPAGNVQLGGTGSDLIQAMDLETKDFRFKVEGNDPINGYNQGLSINANINQAQFYSTTQNSIIGWDSTLGRLTLQSGTLAGITMTNDGTNNMYFDPAGFSLSHNTFIGINFNDTIDKISNINIDSVEMALNYTDTNLNTNAVLSLSNASLSSSFQGANLATSQMNDTGLFHTFTESSNSMQIILDPSGGGRTQLSYANPTDNEFILAQPGNVTLLSTDTSSNVASVIADFSNGVSIDAQVGADLTSLQVDYQKISMVGIVSSMTFDETLGGNITLDPKRSIYYVDTTGGAGSFVVTIPIENCIEGVTITIKDAAGNAGTRSMNISTATGSVEGGLPAINTNYGYLTLNYHGSVWYIIGQG